MKWHEWESNVIWFGWDVLSVRYSVCSGTMSGLYIYIGVCVCVHVCVCIDAHVSVLERIRVGVRASHAYEHICKSVSRPRSGKVSSAPVLIYFRELIGCIVDEHRGRGFQASCCFLCVVAAPEVNVVACSETRPALYQKMEHICVSSSSFCALMSLIWDQSHCRYNDIMCFCG